MAEPAEATPADPSASSGSGQTVAEPAEATSAYPSTGSGSAQLVAEPVEAAGNPGSPCPMCYTWCIAPVLMSSVRPVISVDIGTGVVTRILLQPGGQV